MRGSHMLVTHESSMKLRHTTDWFMDQERKAVCQALSREVGRMHRKTACRNDGNTARQRHSWDEAFAQVCCSPATPYPATTLALACILPSGSTHALSSVRTPLDIFTSTFLVLYPAIGCIPITVPSLACVASCLDFLTS